MRGIKLVSTLLTLPLLFAAACVAGDASDDRADTSATQSAVTAKTTACVLNTPVAWGNGPFCQNTTRRSFNLALGDTHGVCTTSDTGPSGCITFECTASGLVVVDEDCEIE